MGSSSHFTMGGEERHLFHISILRGGNFQSPGWAYLHFNGEMSPSCGKLRYHNFLLECNFDPLIQCLYRGGVTSN